MSHSSHVPTLVIDFKPSSDRTVVEAITVFKDETTEIAVTVSGVIIGEELETWTGDARPYF